MIWRFLKTSIAFGFILAVSSELYKNGITTSLFKLELAVDIFLRTVIFFVLRTTVYFASRKKI